MNPAQAKKQLGLQEEKAAAAKEDARSRSGLARRKLADRDKAGKDAEVRDEAELSKSESEELLFERLEAQREQVRQLYRKPDKTWEWAENNYYHLPLEAQNADLITVNAFWKDFAEHEPGQPFLSENLAEPSRNFHEMLVALAVLDLPFTAPEHASKFEGTQMTFTPAGAAVIFHEEIEPAEAPQGGAKVLVSQNFFRHGDRQRIENGETVDKFVADEFLVHVVYGSQVVITNPTSSRQKLNVLVQIPRGALPVLGSQVTKTLHLTLEPYNTQTVEYYFYFPAAGEFAHFPVHVAKNDKLIAAAEPMTFHVVEKPTKIDKGSWDYVSQHGALEEVVAFLNEHNIDSLNLDKIAWRMQDKEAFATIISILAARHVYSHTLYSYALLHNVVPAANQFLEHAENVVNEAGGRLVSTLLTIDPVERRTYEHLEYKPLFNARAHALGEQRKIVNERFLWQYHRLLHQLAYARKLGDEDLLAVTYYLLLQDRVEQGLATFARVDRENIAEKMQYDYCAAYATFFTDEPERARAIAEKYADHPVDRWRKTFQQVIAQLDEAAGQDADVIDPESRDQQQGQLAATEPSFDFSVEDRQVRIQYRNLESVRINFYEMDVELLFSRNPFVHEFGSNFAPIQPNKSLSIELAKDETAKAVELPPELRNSNVLVEVAGGGETKTQAYFSNSLAVQVVERYGQVAVSQAETHKPVPKAYVKVYAQTATGEVKFYKDGYTDLRGRFDYASLNTNDLDVAGKFSILVLSDEFGATVREAAPPKR
jgi:hypothetical protein